MMMARCLAVTAVFALSASSAAAEQLRRDRVLTPIEPGSIGAVVNTKTIFLNRCASNCTLTSGFTDSRTNKSSIAAGTLTAFKHGTTSWSAVVSCVKDVMKRFNVTITDVDPGPMVDHFEIMIAGTPTQIGFEPGVGGIAQYSCTEPGICSKYLPNTIAFAFANYYPNDPEEICSTVAQELAHTWSLDHSTDPTSPMTYYNSFTGRKQYKDGVGCGSDCVNGYSPLGQPCSGTNTHVCMSTGTNVQNEVQMLLALFGPAGAVAPTLNIKSPATGSAVGPGFVVEAECTSAKPIQEVQLYIDGLMKATLTTTPYRFETTTSLAEGPHKVTVLCATTEQAITTKSVDVILGVPCTGDAQCQPGYICFDSACIAGPDAPGGLGASCTKNEDCKASACASDGTVMACTIPCDLMNKNCPDGFGCLEAGATGVCWAGYDDGGGGCCDAGSDPRGALVLMLGVGAILITRRRPDRHGRRRANRR